MERTKLLTGAVVGLLLLNLVTIGFLMLKPTQATQPDKSGHPNRGEGPVEVIIERLRFDDQQQRQYRQLVEQHRQQTRALSETSVQLYRDYYGLLTASRLDTALAHTRSEQIGLNQQAIAELNFSHFEQIKALCRPNQQADFIRLVGDLGRLFGQPSRPLGRPPGDFRPQP